MKKKETADIFKPSTKQILLSLATAPTWTRLLLRNTKAYESFLSGLLAENFFMNESSERLTIKKIAQQLGYRSVDVTKWLGEVYEDLFDLNMDSESLFKTEGVKHNLIFKYLYDNTASFTVWLQLSPKQYETVYFPLVKAKVGTDRFWVKEVYHNILNGEHEIDVFLNGGILNRYRELLYERALFERKIGFFEAYRIRDFEIDEKLLHIYK